MTRARHVLGTAIRIIAIFFSLGIALYALSFLVARERMFPPPLANSFHARPWSIYPHALFGSIALVLGSVQFWRNLPYGHPTLHRTLGKIYVVVVIGTGTAGLYMSFFSYGGAVTHAGFGLLALSVLTTTAIAYVQIRRRNVAVHREWMLRSFALIFAAVTLRIELPLLIIVFHDFAPAYAIVSWLCWIPNLVLAEVYVRKSRAANSTPLAARPRSPEIVHDFIA